MRPRLLAAAMALTITAGLTTACDTIDHGQASTEMTVSELIARSINADGTVSLQTALWQFSALFGTLPGVTMPPAKPDPPGFKVSGTGALNSVLSHWKELTEEQQQAVAKVITVPADQPARLRAAEQSEMDAARPVIRKAVDDFVSQFTGLLRLKFRIPAPEFTLLDIDDEARAWTHPLADGEVVKTEDNGHHVYPKGGPASRCVMHFPRPVWTGARGGLSPANQVTIAHEVMHCIQGYTFPDTEVYRKGPNWEQDGFAEFAATLVVGSAFPTTWPNYLTRDMSLYQRFDSAMGWWFHLYDLRHPVLSAVPQLWARGELDGNSYYLAVGGADDDVYDTLTSARLREPAFGDAWEVRGTDVSPDKPWRFETFARDGKVTVDKFDGKVGQVSIFDGLEGILRVTAANPIHVHDSAGLERKHITEGDYCLGEECTCPQDTERAGEHIDPIQPPFWLAVPGGEAGNEVLTDVNTLEEYCKKKRERRKPAPHPQPAWAPKHAGGGGGGSGSSGTKPKPATIGDPHLTSVDGHDFDFQASGEFTLIRSDSGDLEIQVRQQPRIKFDGKESDSASMNTAVAANVMGDRISFYADKDRPRVHINGKPMLADTLPKGGKLTPIDAGYSVRWPDGTEMWVINAGAPDSLSVLFGPAAARNGKLHGLVGPFDGTAMFDRGGHRYDKPDFDTLYKKIGDSWRVKDSLFDYEPGESTETFTRRDLPKKPLTLDDLSTAERALGEKACAGVPRELYDRCVFDVAVSGNEKFAVGYRTMDKLRTVGGGAASVGKKFGPQRLEPGQQQTFTMDSDADTLYFASDADCTKPTSATVYWRITMPDGHDTLQVPMCADPGRQTTTKHGTWKIDVWVAPGAEQGGIFAFHVANAGQQRKFDITLPKTADSTMSGAGAEDRYRFTAAAGDKVTLTAKSTCDSDRPLYWGLESPDGNRITLRTKACDSIGQQTITVPGTWSVAIYNSTSDETPKHYAFTVTRP